MSPESRLETTCYLLSGHDGQDLVDRGLYVQARADFGGSSAMGMGCCVQRRFGVPRHGLFGSCGEALGSAEWVDGATVQWAS